MMEYDYPSTKLLYTINSDNQFTNRDYIKSDAARLRDTINSLRASGTITDVESNPFSVTFEIVPASGVSIRNYRSIHSELEMCLGAEVDISFFDGKVCITKKNPIRPIIGLRKILESPEFQDSTHKLPIAFGIDMLGHPLCFDLASMPHMLVAGTTGSGKTVFLDDVILSLVFCRSPEEVQFIIIDPKKCDFNIYNGLPHLIGPVVSYVDNALRTVAAVEDEMMRRYSVFSEISVRDLDTYNARVEPEERLPRIVFIIDEYMDLIAQARAELEDYISRITRLARAAGIHLILATQRPTTNVITPTIKANLPCRASFTTVDARESKAILDTTGAQKLRGNGDMLFSASDSSVAIHAQAAYITIEEIKKVVKHFTKPKPVW